MLEGLLRHGTEMEVEKNYVDTGGQSEVGFAFCRAGKAAGFPSAYCLRSLYMVI
jgi:TnpA family transposase